MKKFKVLIVLLIAAAVFNACASTTDQTNSANANANSPMTGGAAQKTQTSPANTIVISEAEKKNKEVFSSSGNQNNPTVVKSPADDKDSNYNGRSAPDDSTFKSEMNAKGQFLETRTFNNHPQLLKAERYPTEKKILVYLRNGKVVEVAADKLPTFQATIPGTILQAAGVEVVQAPAMAYKNGSKPVEQKPRN